MRVFLLAETDNAQQSFLLAKAMRDHMGWDAKSMVMKETYLKYPTDWTMENNVDEAAEFAKTADLFIFQDQLMTSKKLQLEKYATHRNTIVSGTGSRMRANIDAMRQDQQEGWAIVPMLCDTTISMKLCAPPFENWIVPVERIEELTDGMYKNEKVSVCHAPTKMGYKGTEEFEKILQPWIDSGDIEYERITGVSWEDAIKHKAKHHIILDSLGDTHYNAGNSLEGLVLCQRVISNIDPWCYCLHTNLPMATTWKKDIKQVIDDEIRKTMTDWGETKVTKQWIEERAIGLWWVERHFSAKNQVGKWEQYIKWVMER